MDAFEKWWAEQMDSKIVANAPLAKEAFRAGMRAAAEICRARSVKLEMGNTDHTEEGCYECGAEEEADYLAIAILAEADK